MNLLTVYRVLSFLLLPVAALFAMLLLPGIVIGLANPAFLLSAFLLASVVIYTYCTFRFLIRGIDGKKKCKPVLKDWIRINSFISILFAIETIAPISLVINPQRFHDVLVQVYAQYPKQLQDMWSITQLQKVMEGLLIFFFIYGIVLLIHIFISRFYIRKYAYLFEEAE